MKLTIETKRRIIRFTTVIGVIITIVGSIYISQSEYFQPDGGFSDLLRRLGFMGPIIFILVQISQIIYPIIPLGLTNVIGDLLFGHLWGFLFNTIGMIIGSSINFVIGARFGHAVIRAFISDDDYIKYMGIMNHGHRFKRLLRIGFLAPIFPDDIFCMIAGVSNMRFKQFIGMVIAYRPVSVFIYTYFTSNFIQVVFDYFS